MESKVLALLVADVINKRQKIALNDQEQRSFYREFESEVSSRMEEIRAEKRRAYEEAKNITVR